MILDQNSPYSVGEVTTFPDWVFANSPRQGDVGDSVVLIGSPAGTNVTITGTADSQGS